MLIRRATTEDLQAIQSLNQKLFREETQWCSNYDDSWPFSERGEKYFNFAISDPRGFTIVCEDNGVIVGYAACCLHAQPSSYRKNTHLAELENTYILPQYRRQGLGRKMFAAFKQWAKEQGASQIKVAVLPENDNAIAFYTNQGFTPFELTMEITLNE